MKKIDVKKSVAVGLAGISILAGTIPVNASTVKEQASNKAISSIGIIEQSIKGPSQSDIRLAIRLNHVYNGDICLFSNTEKKFPVGSRLDNNKTYVVNGKISGGQCYAYAQGVFFYLWGDCIGHGDGNYKNSRVVLKNQKSASYDSFISAGVVPGSYCRTTPNKNGSYNGKKGHSMIIVSYNKNEIITLEGNADGKGSIELKTRTWDEFNKEQLTSKGRRICHIISPYTNACPM